MKQTIEERLDKVRWSSWKYGNARMDDKAYEGEPYAAIIADWNAAIALLKQALPEIQMAADEYNRREEEEAMLLFRNIEQLIAKMEG